MCGGQSRRPQSVTSCCRREPGPGAEGAGARGLRRGLQESAGRGGSCLAGEGTEPGSSVTTGLTGTGMRAACSVSWDGVLGRWWTPPRTEGLGQGLTQLRPRHRAQRARRPARARHPPAAFQRLCGALSPLDAGPCPGLVLLPSATRPHWPREALGQLGMGRALPSCRPSAGRRRLRQGRSARTPRQPTGRGPRCSAVSSLGRTLGRERDPLALCGHTRSGPCVCSGAG